MRALLAKAGEYGVHVHLCDLPRGTRGLYDHADRRIFLSLRLTQNEFRSTLAHEIGHAHYGHVGSTPTHERQARAYAAQLLIDPAEYARLEKISYDSHWLADEFSVTPEIISDYQQFHLTRVAGTTYARARMGVGQWAHRAAI